MKLLLTAYLFFLSSFCFAQISKEEFIYDKAPFPSCHASTLAETPNGLICAWFGGTEEKNPDVGIWISRFEDGRWTNPTEVANGLQVDGKRYPSWNPVLFQVPGKELLLFYKVGPNPRQWWGLIKRSYDEGKTWSEAERLPEGIVGPIKNKPVILKDGTILSPSSSEDKGWRVHLESSKDLGKTWTRTEVINDGKEFSIIQPSILFLSNGDLKIICRSQNGYLVSAESSDKGRNWSHLQATELPNPNSGTDAVTLQNGKQLLVYNHVTKNSVEWGGKRSPLNVALSEDGVHWKEIAVLENEPKMEFSYPAVIQTKDGKVHITYTWKREKIKHVVMDVSGL